MVPPLLSSNLCSLRGNEERLAFSVIWKLDENAEIVDVDFCKSIICSKVWPGSVPRELLNSSPAPHLFLFFDPPSAFLTRAGGV